MALTTVAVTAETIGDTVASLGIESTFDAALAAITNNLITTVQVDAKDRQSRQGKFFSVELAYDNAAAPATLLSPYQLRVFDGRTLDEALTDAAAFRTANPTYFFPAPLFGLINHYHAASRPFIVYQIYTTDGTNGPLNWSAEGSPLLLAGDVTGVIGANTVERIRNTNVDGAPAAGGQQLIYDAVSGNLQWYSLPVYTSLANAAADQANQIIGARVVIFGSAGGAEDGTYQLTAKTGAAGDYTKISDHTDTASEVLIVDAGGFYTASEVESALQELGGAVLGGISYSGLTAGTTVIDSIAIATYRGATWEVTTDDGAGNVEIFTVQASHDGATAQYTVTGPGPQGTVPVTASVAVNGANLELSLTITGGSTWEGRVLRRPALI